MERILSDEAREWLEATRGRVQTLAAARRIWHQVLTDRQRRQIGDPNAASHQLGGIVGIWQKLHGCSEPEAVIELGRLLGFLDVEFHRWLQEEIGGKGVVKDVEHPEWVPERGELRFRGKVIREVRVTIIPTSLQLVLAAFEAAGWPARIDNPFRSSTSHALSDVLYTLNKDLKLIKFHSQKGGAVIT